MRGSGINKSHEFCGKVQDAYSLRCAAQVHGATREALRFVRDTVDDRSQQRHRQPDGVRRHRRHRVGRQLPRRADRHRRRPARRRASCRWRRSASGAPIGSSIRRSAACRRSSPATAACNSGFMMAQVTAAAVASELKIARASGRRRHDPDLGEQGRPRQHEHDAPRSRRSARSSRAREVIAIEMLCACQAIDLLAPLDDVAAARRACTRSCDRACRRSTTTARRRPISSRSRN